MLRLTVGDRWKKHEKELRDIERQFNVSEFGFLADLYEMYASKGRALIRATKVSPVVKQHMKDEKITDFREAHKVVNRQFNVLASLKKAKFFTRLCDADALYAVESTISLLKDFMKKAQPTVCMACKLYTQCQFGQQFNPSGAWDQKARQTRELAQTGAPSINFKLPFHPECPEPPYAETVASVGKLIGVLIKLTQPLNAMIMAAQMRKQGNVHGAMVLEKLAGIPPASTKTTLEEKDPKGQLPPAVVLEDKVSELGQKNSDVFDATFTGKQMFEGIHQMVNTLTSSHLMLWELNRVFDREIAVEKEGKLLATETPDDEIEINVTDRAEDVVRALPHELAGSDDEFYKKLTSRDLQIREDRKPQEKANLLYIIFDVSGSMSSSINPNQYALVNRANLATAMSLSLLKKAMDEKSMAFFRFFASVPNRVRIAEKKDEFVDLCRMIGLGDSNGGGTDIMAALLVGAKDIQDAKLKGVKKAELVLVSDGLSDIDEDALRKGLKGVRMHVLDVSGDAQISGGNTELAKLKRVAATFFQVDPNHLDLSNIAASVTSKEDSKEKRAADEVAKKRGEEV